MTKNTTRTVHNFRVLLGASLDSFTGLSLAGIIVFLAVANLLLFEEPFFCLAEGMMVEACESERSFNQVAGYGSAAAGLFLSALLLYRLIKLWRR